MMSVTKAYDELDILAEEVAKGGKYNMSKLQASGLLSAIKKVYGEYRFREMSDYFNMKVRLAKGEYDA
jgi:hypothetical protein